MTRRGAMAFAICALCLFAGCTFWTSGSDTLTGLEGHTGSVQQIIDLVHAGKPDEALRLLDSLHSAVVALRSDLRGLRLTGEREALSDPVTLPSGTYRVHFTTEGSGIVELFDMQGARLWLGALFAVTPGDASGGASTLYRSTGQQVLVQFSIISAPYTLVFESL